MSSEISRHFQIIFLLLNYEICFELGDNLNGEFYSIDTTDILITISMDQNAFTVFREQQLEKGVSYSDFLNSFLEDKIG